MRAAASVPLKSVALPAEHGGWGFTLEPVLLGLLLSPGPSTLGLFLLGLFGFLARHPFKLAYQDLSRRKHYPRTNLALKIGWAYLALAVAGFALTVLTARGPFVYPLFLALPLGIYTLWMDARNRSRELLPEVAAALAMATLAPAGALAGGLKPEVALGSFLALALRDVASLYHARTQVLRARGRRPKIYPALLALCLAVVSSYLLARAGLIPFAALLVLVLLAIYGALTLALPPVPARLVGWGQLGFGALLVVAIVLGYELQGVPTALVWAPALHAMLGRWLILLAFLTGAALLFRDDVPRPARAILGLYDLNAFLGLAYVALGGKLLPHPPLALVGLVAAHLGLKRTRPWPGIGFLLLGALLLWH